MWIVIYTALCVVASEPQKRSTTLGDVEAVPNILFADIVAGHRANAALFTRSRVTWCYVKYVSPMGFYQWLEKTSANLKDQSAVAAEPDERRKAESRSARFENILKLPGAQTPPESSWYWMDNWTDGRRIQLRSPKDAPLQGEQGKQWLFPDDPLTPETLLTSYGDHQIWSFMPDAAKQLRCWSGKSERAPYYQGTTRTLAHPIEAAFGDYLFPPLLAPIQCKSDEAIHPIDRVWDDFRENGRVLGAARVGGRRVLVVEATNTFSPFVGAEQRGMVGRTVNRVFIDPERGNTPLRAEYGFKRSIDGHDIDTDPIIRFAMECTEIASISNGGFYPMQGLYEELAFTDGGKILDDFEGMTKCFESGGSQPNMSVKKRENWKIVRVVPNPEMPDAMFALEFPKDTLYVDLDERQALIVGVPDSEVNDVASRRMEAPNQPSEPAAARSVWRPVFLAMNVVFIVVCIFLIAIRHRRAVAV